VDLLLCVLLLHGGGGVWSLLVQLLALRGTPPREALCCGPCWHEGNLLSCLCRYAAAWQPLRPVRRQWSCGAAVVRWQGVLCWPCGRERGTSYAAKEYVTATLEAWMSSWL
jgi:hypothetical protein